MIKEVKEEVVQAQEKFKRNKKKIITKAIEYNLKFNQLTKS